MKNLFTLLIGLMLVNNIYGQILIRDYSDIETNGYVERNIHCFKDNLGDYSWIENIHFIKNEYLYVFAYEPLVRYAIDGYMTFMEGERNLYLYRKDIRNIDNPWIVSSDVIMTNYVRNLAMDFKDVLLTTKNFHGDADIIQNKDEYTITIGVYVFENGHLLSTGLQTFILIPAENGFYKIKKGSDSYKPIKL
jgi:hypothetical protein